MQLVNKKPLAGLVAAFLATACLGFASWGFHNSSDRTKDVTFSSTVKFENGATLAAGTYRMEVPDNSPTPKVTFSQNGKVVVTVPAQVVSQRQKNEETEIVAQTQGKAQAVTAIRPQGWNEELTFVPTGK